MSTDNQILQILMVVGLCLMEWMPRVHLVGPMADPWPFALSTMVLFYIHAPRLRDVVAAAQGAQRETASAQAGAST